jgi:drug/metabolite transporter (DMT)-like permease
MFGFGAGFVLTQFGLRWMQPWLGVAISILTSTLLFWCLAPFFVDPSDGDLRAVILFACVGLFFPGAAALLNFESNRLLGPNIAGALSSMTPVLAIVILGESIRGPQILALAAIVVGISLMYRVHVNLSAHSLWLMALPLTAAAIRGMVQPIVKFGFEWWSNPIAAVVVSYTVSSAVLIFSALARASGTIPEIDHRGALWFAAVGLCNGPFCPSDVRCPRIWAGYGHLTADRRLPFGDLAAEPCFAGERRRGSSANRRSFQRGLRRRVAARGVAMRRLSIGLHTGRPMLVVGMCGMVKSTGAIPP